MFGPRQAGVLLAIASIASAYPSHAHPPHSAHTAHSALSRRQNNNGFIETAGVVANGTGTVGYRKEIHALREDEDSWNMFLLGLSRFKDVDGRDPMSYYQISAIHGQPYVAWDNNGPCDDCQPAGYCTHQSCCSLLLNE